MTGLHVGTFCLQNTRCRLFENQYKNYTNSSLWGLKTMIKFLTDVKGNRILAKRFAKIQTDWKVTEYEEQKQDICITAVCDDGIYLYAGACVRRG